MTENSKFCSNVMIKDLQKNLTTVFRNLVLFVQSLSSSELKPMNGVMRSNPCIYFT